MDKKVNVINKAKELTEGRNYGKNEIAIVMIALKENLDASQLLKVDTFAKMKEVLEGLRANIDVTLFATDRYTSGKMRLIRNALTDNVEVADILSMDKFISENSLEFILGLRRQAELNSSDRETKDQLESYIKLFVPMQVPSKRLKLLFDSYVAGVSSFFTLDKNRSDAFLETALVAKLKGYKFNDVVNADLLDSQLIEIKQAMMEKADISLMLNNKFSSLQLRQLRLGLVNGLDVSEYADPSMSANDMKEKRVELMVENRGDIYDESYNLSERLLD